MTSAVNYKACGYSFDLMLCRKIDLNFKKKLITDYKWQQKQLLYVTHMYWHIILYFL